MRAGQEARSLRVPKTESWLHRRSLLPDTDRLVGVSLVKAIRLLALTSFLPCEEHLLSDGLWVVLAARSQTGLALL